MIHAYTVVIRFSDKANQWEGGYLWAKDENEAKHRLYELYPRIKKLVPDIVTWEIGGEVVGDVNGNGYNPEDPESYEPYMLYIQLDLLMTDLERMEFASNIAWKSLVQFFDAKEKEAERDDLILTLANKRPELLR